MMAINDIEALRITLGNELDELSHAPERSQREKLRLALSDRVNELLVAEVDLIGAQFSFDESHPFPPSTDDEASLLLREKAFDPEYASAHRKKDVIGGHVGDLFVMLGKRVMRERPPYAAPLVKDIAIVRPVALGNGSLLMSWWRDRALGSIDYLMFVAGRPDNATLPHDVRDPWIANRLNESLQILADVRAQQTSPRVSGRDSFRL